MHGARLNIVLDPAQTAAGGDTNNCSVPDQLMPPLMLFEVLHASLALVECANRRAAILRAIARVPAVDKAIDRQGNDFERTVI